jgi:hypothetical protein
MEPGRCRSALDALVAERQPIFVRIDRLAEFAGEFRSLNLCVVCSREFNRYVTHALHLMPND